MMNDRLAQTVALCRRTGTYGALLFADLDNFKPLNDNYGHDAADLLLIEAANRLKHVVREVDTVARYGGDEFVVIVSELSHERSEAHKQAEQIAVKMLSRLMEPFVVMLPSKHNSIEYVCGASIGAVLFSDDKEHEEIVRYGDIAMYKAKEAGRAQVVFYEES
ncbi:MAG: GGDEF domain-containing protein [Epsilonproteobacteria bacterium]|nr:GGDEF domain-containing protein [Campylobacterota bacterium]